MDLIKKNYKKIIIVILMAFSLLSLVMGCKNAINYSQDFQYDAAKVLLMGMNPYDESLEPSKQLLDLGLEEYYLQMEANQFPSLLYLLAPYTLLKPLQARYAWLFSNLIFTGIVIWLLRKTFLKDLEGENFAITALLMVAGTPWRNHIGVGNHTIFAFMFFLLAVFFSEGAEGKIWKVVLSGFSLCVAYFKYTLTVPLALYFLYKKKYKEIVISVLPHLLLTPIAAHKVNDSLLNMLVKPLKVSGALSGEGSMDIGALLGGGLYTVIFTAAIMLGLLILTMKLKVGMEAELISVLLLWSLIMTYHRSYDYFVLVLALGIQVSKRAITTLGLNIYMPILVVFLFFGLRIFNEATWIMYLAAFVYYTYTLLYTFCVVKQSREKVEE